MNLQKARNECIWDNIKMDLNEMEWEEMDCIHLAQDGDKWWALVNMVMKFQIPQNAGNFLIAEELLASREGPYSMESVMVEIMTEDLLQNPKHHNSLRKTDPTHLI
jgi:hypothetical protein